MRYVKEGRKQQCGRIGVNESKLEIVVYEIERKGRKRVKMSMGDRKNFLEVIK